MNPKDHPMPFDFASYLADTTHLSTTEHGAYILILGAMWRSPDGHIEGDDKYLARVAKLPLDKWKRIASTMRALLSIRSNDGRVSQKRLLRVRAQMQNATEPELKTAPGRDSGNGPKPLKNKKPPPDPDNSLFPSLESNSESNKTTKKGRAIPLPENWQPEESEILYGKSTCHLTDAEIAAEAEKMRRWALNNSHRSIGRKPRWDLAFRNWLDRVVKERGGNETPNRQHGAGPNGGGQGRSGPASGYHRHTNADAIATGLGQVARKFEKQRVGSSEGSDPDAAERLRLTDRSRTH